MENQKPIHSIILDAGPILKNEPPISTLLAKSETIFTIPSVISEIKDVSARSRVETTLKPFLTIKTPSIQSLKFVTDFARKTGDLAVLSRTDLQVLALAYELECERNGGDWRLRKVPGQKGLNGMPPRKKETAVDESQDPITQTHSKSQSPASLIAKPSSEEPSTSLSQDATTVGKDTQARHSKDSNELDSTGQLSEEVQNLDLQTLDPGSDTGSPQKQFDETNRYETKGISPTASQLSDVESSDSEGWITPSNVKKHQAKDLNSSTAPISSDTIMQVATITTDFAMQNVLLQVGLNLLSPSLQRVRNIRTYILRCHACFEKVKDTSKQFCPRCGKPTLTRVSCSTNHKGEFSIHLKKNMQWNHRGDRFSIPRPVPGAANGKVGQGKGGGKGGWGQELILAEDQKEYLRATNGRGVKELDLMDNDYLPGILTGDRGRAGGRPKIGGGRNVNSKKRG